MEIDPQPMETLMTATRNPLHFNEDDLTEMLRHASEATRLLKNLANEYRLMIVCQLAGGELSVGELNRYVPLSQSALSQHLSRLREDGIVATRRESQTIYYCLTHDPAIRVITALHEVYCGDPRTDRHPTVKRGNGHEYR